MDRRHFLGVGIGAIGALALGASAGAAPGVVLWRLDPEWGTPLLTTSGRTKVRCAGRACHNAAPHRFFASEADALAGRLHPCCLAQPLRVEIPIDPSDVPAPTNGSGAAPTSGGGPSSSSESDAVPVIDVRTLDRDSPFVAALAEATITSPSAAGLPGSPSSPTSNLVLPATGATLAHPVLIGASALVTGALALRIAHRRPLDVGERTPGR